MTNQLNEVAIDSIKPYENKPRKNQTAVNQIARSIKEFGFNQPIVVDANNVIVVGHTRWKAAKQLNLSTVPVLKLPADMNQERIDAYRIADNKLNELSSWDDEKLYGEIRKLYDKEFDLTLTGFTDDELQFYIDKGVLTEAERENHIPELNAQPKTSKGDVWILGEHKLICGDSTDTDNWRAILDGEQLNCVFTSPPYNLGDAKGKGLYDDYNDNKGSEEYLQFNRSIISAIKPHLKGFLFYNISYNLNSRWEFIDVLADIKNQLKFLELIVWRKNQAMPTGTSQQILRRDYEDVAVYSSDDAYEDIEWLALLGSEKSQAYVRKTNKKISNHWEISVAGTQVDKHKACYPVALPERGITMTTKKNEIVGDPFGGTGTTMIACEKLDRKARLIELSPMYCDIAVRRWEEYTGNSAYCLQTGKTFGES